MSYSETVTRQDLIDVLNNLDIPQGGGSASGTSIPTPDEVAEFDSNSHMNSEDMTSQDVDDFVDGLNFRGGTLGDFVIEQGTSGVWHYRKWNSGDVELWGRTTVTLSPYSTVNSWHGFYTQLTLPFTVYAPVVTYTVKIGSGFAIPASALGYAESASLSAFNVYGISNSSGSQTTVWVCDVKGRWR